MSEGPDRTIATQPVDRTIATDDGSTSSGAPLDAIEVSGVAPTMVSQVAGTSRVSASSIATHATVASAGTRASAMRESRTASSPSSGATLTGELRGSMIGKFMVLRKLGEGGMGQVYAAYDTELDRKVAIKLLRANYQSATAIKRLQREAQSLAKLSHPNVVQVYDWGQHHGAVFIAMEYVEGQTLREFLAERSDRTWRTTLATLLQAGQGLAAAHASSLVHRDFKPDNIMVANDGQVRVLDFGLVRNVEPEAPAAAADADTDDQSTASHDDAIAGSPAAKQLTRTGAIMGTPAYMALEQLEGRRADAHTDQFAFCVVLYEALYGYRPFEGDTGAAVAARMYAGEIRPRPAKSDVPRAVHDAIVRGLAADPAKRWPDMSKLLDALSASLEHGRRAWWLGLGALGAMVALVVIATPLVREALNKRDQTIAAQEVDLAARALELEQAAAELAVRNQDLQRQFDIQAGLTATLLAESPGRSLEALRLAIDVYGRYALARVPPPLAIEAGLFAATRRLHDAHELPAQTERIDTMQFSPDGARLVTGGRDDTAKLWDARSGELLRTFSGHVDDVRGVQLSADGARLLTTSADASATVWLVETGKVLATIDDYDVSVARFSPNGQLLAIGSEDGTLSLWNAELGEEIVELGTVAAAGPLASLRFADDGQRLASATTKGIVQLWEGKTERARFEAVGASRRTLAFSPDGTRLAAPAPDGAIQLRDGRSGALLDTLDAAHGELFALAFAPAGRPRLLSTGREGRPKLWHGQTGMLIAEIDGHREAATDVAFAPDGSRFATVSYDARLRIGDAGSGRVLETLEGPLGALGRVQFSPDGSQLASLESDRVVRLWSTLRVHDQLRVSGRGHELASLSFSHDRSLVLAGERGGHAGVWAVDGDAGGQLVHDLDHEGRTIYGVAFSSDGARLATGDTAGVARIWDAYTGELMHALAGPPSDIKALAFSPDGRTLASADLHGMLRLWTVETGALVREWKAAEQGVSAVAFTPDGTGVASCGLLGFVSVWNVDTGERVRLLPSEGLLFALAFSPDGARLAVAGASKRIDIWDVAGEQRVTSLVGEDPSIDSLAFSPDGQRLLTAGDAWVRLWDVASGMHVADFATHDARLLGVAFSPDGKLVLSGSADGHVRASIADADQRLRGACMALRGTREFGDVATTCEAVLEMVHTP